MQDVPGDVNFSAAHVPSEFHAFNSEDEPGHDIAEGKDQVEGRIGKFLDEIYRLSHDEKFHAAGDLIFDFIQGLLKNRDFKTCNRLLSAVDVARLEPPSMITFLSSTLAAKGQLGPARDHYRSRVLETLTRDRGEEEATKLLDKYR